MLQGVYDTPGGKIAALTNEFRTKGDEYAVASLFQDRGLIVFAQFVGLSSPRGYLDKGYNVTRVKLDGGKSFLYTISDKRSFHYKLPFPEHEMRAFIAPTKEAAMMMFQQLTGIADKTLLQEYFVMEFEKDEGPMRRYALYVRQNHSTSKESRGDLITKFEAQEKEPVYFRGGITVG